MDRAAAWEVTEPGGNRALFKDLLSADSYAVRTHGTRRALFYGRRRSDDPPADDDREKAAA